MELPLFTAACRTVTQCRLGLCVFLILSSPCRKLQHTLAECWGRVRTGACHDVVMSLNRAEDVKTRETRTSRHLTP